MAEIWDEETQGPQPETCGPCAAGDCAHHHLFFNAVVDSTEYGLFACVCLCDPDTIAALIEEDEAARSDGLYSTDEAATELGIDSSLIRKWKHRGHVSPRQFIPGRGRGGVVPLYDLEDLRPLVTAYQAKQGSDTP